MNYLFVMPRELSVGARTTSVIFPLGIAYVSAAMKQGGFSVFTMNLDLLDGNVTSILRGVILEHEIDVLCTGGLSLDYHKIKDLIDTAREIKPNIITVVGGGIISSDPETAMQNLSADIGIIGEGEVTMCELATALDQAAPISGVDGLIYRDEALNLIKTAPRKEIEDIDSIPFPDFEGFAYREWLESNGGGGVILSDRSCPFLCTFCFHPTGHKYRQRSLDNIMEEIDLQVSHYQIRSIGLTSELFATSKDRVLDFCARIERYNLTWSCCLRVTDVDLDMLKGMKLAGCRLICFGFESADDSVLKSMRKGITSAQIARALDLSYEAGIATDDSNFIFGDINETWATVENTIAFWRQYNTRVHINLDLIQTYPGTHLYEHACKTGIIPDRGQFLRDGCPIVNVSKLSSSEFHRLRSLVTELRMHPHVPAASVRISSITEDGSCELDFTCRKCGAPDVLNGRLWFTGTCYCKSCGAKNEVDSLRGAECREDRLLQHLSGESSIALWGAGGIYYKIMANYPQLASPGFMVVDTNPQQQGLVICQKVVQPPERIHEEVVHTVIITALSRQKDISQVLAEDYPSVRSILIPSFERDREKIIPVLVESPIPQRTRK